MPSRRPKTLKIAKRRAWAALSLYVRQKHADDSGRVRCVTCNQSLHYADAHCGHYQHGLTWADQGAGIEAVEVNLAPQCVICNTYKHGALDAYTLYILDRYGRDTIDELRRLRQVPLKLKIDDYWELEQRYTRLTDAL